MSHCRTFAVELVEMRKKSIWGYYSDHMKVLKCILCVLNLAKPYFMCTFFLPPTRKYLREYPPPHTIC